MDSLKNTELVDSQTRDGKEWSFRQNTSANGWLPQQSGAITTKSIWPVCTSHTRDYADMHIEKMLKNIESHCNKKHFRVISGDFNAQLWLRIDSEEDYVEEHTTGQTNKRGIWIRQWCMIQNYVALITTFKKTTENSAPAHPWMEKRNIWTAW